jgi:DNA-binding transcriptional regulator WhiA
MINKYQFIGIMIGDGCLLYYPKHRIYGIEITGNAVEEVDFYNSIKQFLKLNFNVNVRVYIRKYHNGKAIKLICYNKKLADWLKEYGITCNKTFSTKIPENLTDWRYSKFIIKGIFQTDGCLYFSKSKKCKYPTYPRIEICTASLTLAKQIVSILNNNGFSARSYINKNTITIYLSGERMLQKWITEIGFSTNKNQSKYLLWKKLGYYIPRITLPKRLSLLESKDLQIIPETI